MKAAAREKKIIFTCKIEFWLGQEVFENKQNSME